MKTAHTHLLFFSIVLQAHSCLGTLPKPSMTAQGKMPIQQPLAQQDAPESLFLNAARDNKVNDLIAILKNPTLNIDNLLLEQALVILVNNGKATTLMFLVHHPKISPLLKQPKMRVFLGRLRNEAQDNVADKAKGVIQVLDNCLQEPISLPMAKRRRLTRDFINLNVNLNMPASPK